ncbi:MAG: replicative DNA helicase [Ruminococcaceae bacterium]|nr:replicative DNA helicase [Oscillospiraceae bacterium]
MDSQINSTIGSLKQMPYSLEAEQAVLGAILTNPELIEQVPQLRADDFYLDQHKVIFEAMFDLASTSRPIDPVLILEALEKSKHYEGPDAVKYLKMLIDSSAYAGNVTEYSDIIRDKAVLRRLIDASRATSDEAYSGADDVDAILDRAEQRLHDISNEKYNTNFVHIKQAIRENYDIWGVLRNNPDAFSGTKTGYSDLDNYIVGMNPGDLIIVGARPGMGKTTFCMNLAVNVAKSYKEGTEPPDVAVFSLEMPPQQLASRMLAGEALVDHHKLRTGDMTDDEWKKLAQAASVLAKTNILIDETSNITVMNMRSKLRKLKNLKLVIIDYLQLMHTEKHSDNRVLEIGEITRGLKLMAKDLGVPLVLCSQLRREQSAAGGRSGKSLPQLHDLRDSGSIEQDADVVLFLHRDSYGQYGDKPEGGEDGAQEVATTAVMGENEIEIAKCIVAKNRHGSTGTVKLAWLAKNYRFVSVENRGE